MQIDDKPDAVFFRKSGRILDFIEPLVQPAVILIEVKFRIEFVPVAHDLHANQIDVPLFQGTEHFFCHRAGRRHHAAQPGMLFRFLRIFDFIVQIDPGCGAEYGTAPQ